MKILHIAQNTDGYEEVTLLANAVDRHNNLAVYEKDGKVYMTGGFILNDTPEIRAMLDRIPKENLYDFIWSVKVNPFVKFYYDEEKVKQQEAEDFTHKKITSKEIKLWSKLKAILVGV